jgi:hypothetical protein
MKPSKKRVGRPPGKHSDPKYSQRSVWLPKALQVEVLKALVTPEGKRFEFSALVEHFLRRWLKDGAKLPKE